MYCMILDPFSSTALGKGSATPDNLKMLIVSLPARASEQGNVIGSVRIYICVYKKNCN